MATSPKEKPTQAAIAERRKSGQFATGYTDAMRYELVEAVTVSVDPNDPVSVSQPRFDREAPAIAAALGWPEPPRAITMRLKKGWELIKEEATKDRSVQQILARADGVSQSRWLDERDVCFAVRRVHLHLGRSESETLYPHEYERGRNELIAQAKRLKHTTFVEELLPTRGQLLWLFAGDWDQILQLCLLPVRQRASHGHSLLKLAEHYYEMKNRLPATLKAIKVHASQIRVACPWREADTIEEVLDELIADRAKRELPTPDDGPVEGARLSEKQIEELIADAPPPRVKRFWTEADVIESFADFAEEFEGQHKLNQSLYNQHRKEHGWPSNVAWQKHGKLQEMIEKGRKRARARRKEAA